MSKHLKPFVLAAAMAVPSGAQALSDPDQLRNRLATSALIALDRLLQPHAGRAPAGPDRIFQLGTDGTRFVLSFDLNQGDDAPDTVDLFISHDGQHCDVFRAEIDNRKPLNLLANTGLAQPFE